jgi:hypothetical protein
VIKISRAGAGCRTRSSKSFNVFSPVTDAALVSEVTMSLPFAGLLETLDGWQLFRLHRKVPFDLRYTD